MEYKICTRCVMDTSDPDIEFDKDGICNHCKGWEKMAMQSVINGDEGIDHLRKVFRKIKADGLDGEYDCLLGVSGGVDSSYLVYLAMKYSLNPLLVSIDNGWDDKIATENVQKIVDVSGFDMIKVDLNLKEYHDLQRAYIKSGVVNIEAVFDHVIQAILFPMAADMGIKYVLIGTNVNTEEIMPAAWGYPVLDLKNLRSIHEVFGEVELKTYPTLNPWKGLFYYRILKGLKYIDPLNWIEYNRKRAKETITNMFGWKDYGHKHFESVFTRFYQAYILPYKYGVDKRKPHFSSLIMSGEMTREQALEELDEPYYSEEMFKHDYKQILETLNFTEKEFTSFMMADLISHEYYNHWFVFPKVRNMLKKALLVYAYVKRFVRKFR